MSANKASPYMLAPRATRKTGRPTIPVVNVAMTKNRNRARSLSESLESRDGVILGLVQGLSAIPGLSRSGLTTSALLIRNYSGEEAFRISFLMSVPAVFAAAVGLMYLEGVPALESGLLASLAASFISAYLSIDVLLRVARGIRFWGLCVLLGTLAILPQVVYLF